MRQTQTSISANRIHLVLAVVCSIFWIVCLVAPLPAELNNLGVLRGILLISSAFLLSLIGASAIVFSRRRGELFYAGICMSQALPCFIVGSLIDGDDRYLLIFVAIWFALPLLFVALNLYVKKRQR